MDLTKEQVKAFNRLKRAFKACEDANILLINQSNQLTAYNSEYVAAFGDNHSGFPPDETIPLMDFSGSTASLPLPQDWADDDFLHRLHLTPKGLKNLRGEE